jgi:uncharacterized membrane protein YphA (DoxX/SURF4 family)
MGTLLAIAVEVGGSVAVLQHIMFFKNMAICGGLMMMVSFGPGAWSVDTKSVIE